MYIFVEWLDNDFKDVEEFKIEWKFLIPEKFNSLSYTAVQHLWAKTSNISIRNSNFPIPLCVSPHNFFPSHHHLSMLLFDFIQQTDISLFGFLNWFSRACACVYYYPSVLSQAASREAKKKKWKGGKFSPANTTVWSEKSCRKRRQCENRVIYELQSREGFFICHRYQ